MHRRLRLLDNLADIVAALPCNPVLRIAIDGVDGAGKTTFADELPSMQRRYLREHNPQELASIVIDNNDLASPLLVMAYSRAARG